MTFSFVFFLSLFEMLIEGTVTTIVLLFVSGIIGNLLAVPVALTRVSPNPVLWIPSYLYILVMRGTPLLVQIYLIYYGLGSIFGELPWLRESFLWPYLRQGFWYAAAALAFNTAAYSGEILRGAIQAVPHGEVEAGKAFGMSRWLILWRVVLPKAIRISLPVFGGETILLLKATALASTVTVMDMLGVVNRIRADTFRTYEPLFAAAVIYIVLTFILTRVFIFAEKRLNKDRLPPKTLAPTGAAAKPAA
jgi:His/Glu/Gln/Arg/opine family amino acid ABC transporter permease subunit